MESSRGIGKEISFGGTASIERPSRAEDLADRCFWLLLFPVPPFSGHSSSVPKPRLLFVKITQSAAARGEG